MPVRVGDLDAFRGWLEGRHTDDRRFEEAVAPILSAVEREGDAALARYAREFGDEEPRWITASEIADARVSPELEAALDVAAANIRSFAERQLPQEWSFDTPEGATVGQIVRPVESAGCYVPGGRYPLPSTVLMTAIPAHVAGVERIVIVCPRPTAEVLAAARRVPGAQVLQLGGAQAIAALAFGTATIPKVDLVVGPGNAYVAAAKRLVANRIGIEFSAGPSEVMIVAGEGANPDWVAADLIAQAEHDPDASAVFVTSESAMAPQVKAALERRLADLPTAETARLSLTANGWIVIGSREDALAAIDAMAPEHLCLWEPDLLPFVRNAGSIFLGPYAVEAVGDYASGPNHTLPTGGVARRRGGLSAGDFVKVISVQSMPLKSLESLAPHVAILARAEGLEGHARSVEARRG